VYVPPVGRHSRAMAGSPELTLNPPGWSDYYGHLYIMAVYRPSARAEHTLDTLPP
jgi:hypothetical protein